MAEKSLWPKMMYHPTNGEYVICNTKDEVPKGYVDSLTKVKPPKTATAEKKASPEPAPKPPVRKARPKTKAPGKKPSGPTLASLKLDRDEALEILAEQEIEMDEDATDAAIAAEVAKVLG